MIFAHTSIIGETGYNCHARNFFTELDKITPVSVRNATVGSTWTGFFDEPHNSEYYMTDQLRKMLKKQSLIDVTSNSLVDYPIYKKYIDDRTSKYSNINIILNDNLHEYFNQSYTGLKIAYNVWETTRQPFEFFEQLKTFDQVWVPSKWQAQCTIDQGIPAHKVKVVPEGVDVDLFKPIKIKKQNKTDPFQFIVIGRWEYRKSTKEIIDSFIKAFPNNENVELLLVVDNPFANDGVDSTEQRLTRFNLIDDRIKVVHSLPKDEYVNLLQNSNVFISCSRGEGWNLPLIEAMACGIPALYSNWGAQLEFAEGRGIPVDIIGEVPASVPNNESWNQNAPGNFSEPNFEDLIIKLRYVYCNYTQVKAKALADSKYIRSTFTWKNSANLAIDILDELDNSFNHDEFAWVTCGNLQYMKLIEKLVISLNEFSKRPIIVYGINCEVPFASKYPNVIARSLPISNYSIHDKWYWKQHACIQSLTENFKNYIWVDGDVIANYNIDDLGNYFNLCIDYPIPDIHIQEEFVAYYTDVDGSSKSQLFNEELCKFENITRGQLNSHICLYLYNKNCKWWFDEILKYYYSVDLDKYSKLLQWNDEGLDNFLRWKYNSISHLPVSNFDVSAWNGETLSESNETMYHFLRFWNDSGPINFGKIYGWQFIPKDKSSIKYFHGNKNLEFADFMISYIKMMKDSSFYDSHYFYIDDYLIKNLGEIYNIEGATLDIANKYSWFHAIYHEIYNLRDYEHLDFVKINNGDIVVELGGNIGIFTRFAHQCGASKIITFEPDRRYFNLLRKNAHPSTILFNAAISDKIGTLMLTESSHLGGSTLLEKLNHNYVQYDVNTYTLDYLFSSNLIDRIDFLKIDIEGSEISALSGISDENLQKVNKIAIEYHHAHLNYDENLRSSIINRLNNLGFNSYLLFCGYDNALQLIYFWR